MTAISLRPAVNVVLTTTGVYRALMRRNRYEGVAVLAYHAVRGNRQRKGAMRLEGLHVTARELDEQCRVLRDSCNLLTFDDWTRIAAGERALPERAALVTFDDGYRSVLTEALPILERHGVPALVFPCTDPVERRRHFWFDVLATRRGEQALDWAKALPWSEWRVLAAECDEPADEGGPMAPLTIDELRDLAASPLIAIGCHTATHPIMARAPIDVQRAELRESRAKLEAWLGRPVTAFAYPNGRPRVDYTGDTIRALVDCGFEHAFAVGQGFARFEMSPFEHNRFLMLAGMRGRDLAHRLAWAWPRLARAVS